MKYTLIRDAAPVFGKTPKSLGQQIRYALEKRPEDFAKLGLDPSSVKYGINDPYLPVIANVLGQPLPEAQGEPLSTAVQSDTKEEIVDPDAPSDAGEGLNDKLPTPKMPPPPPPRKVKPTYKPRGKAATSKVSSSSITSRLSGETALWLIIIVIVLSDGLACWANFWTMTAGEDYVVQVSSSLIFAVVGLFIGYSAVVNYLNADDKETRQMFAFGFVVYQLAIHLGWIFDYPTVGAVAEIGGLVIALPAALVALRDLTHK